MAHRSGILSVTPLADTDPMTANIPRYRFALVERLPQERAWRIQAHSLDALLPSQVPARLGPGTLTPDAPDHIDGRLQAPRHADAWWTGDGGPWAPVYALFLVDHAEHARARAA